MQGAFFSTCKLTFMSMDGRTDICSSAIAPRQQLLRCPNKLHPCNDAISALPPLVVVVFRKDSGRRCDFRLNLMHFNGNLSSYNLIAEKLLFSKVNDNFVESIK